MGTRAQVNVQIAGLKVPGVEVLTSKMGELNRPEKLKESKINNLENGVQAKLYIEKSGAYNIKESVVLQHGNKIQLPHSETNLELPWWEVLVGCKRIGEVLKYVDSHEMEVAVAGSM